MTASSERRASKDSGRTLASSVVRQHLPLVREGPKEDEMREHRNDHPETAVSPRWGTGTAKQESIPQTDYACADRQ